MAAATTMGFKDLCIDAVNPEVVASFWAAALGLHAEPSGADFRLVDNVPEHTLWVNEVPESRTVKQRVHIDVHVAAVSELTELGASILDETQPWTVLADPEGGELCAFVREPEDVPDYRVYEVVVDSADPAAIAAWWAQRYAAEVCHDRDRGFSWIDGARGMPWSMVFQWVPEPKTVKNRVHWDVWGETETFLAAGARLLRSRDDEIGWDVLADPEGNEFCVFTRHEI
jgi:glyoxalase superfamily protein